MIEGWERNCENAHCFIKIIINLNEKSYFLSMTLIPKQVSVEL